MKIYFTTAAFCLCTLLSMAQLPAYVPTNGLLGFWPFCGNANDHSGNNNNGTVNGAASTADRFNAAGMAYSFNGTSNYISTSMTGVQGNGSRAVSFWAKTTESISTLCGVSWGDEQSFPNAGVRYECAFNEGTPGNPIIIGADCAVGYSAPVNIANNAWHHYVFQFNGGGSGQINQVEIYQDGVLLTNKTYTHNPSTILNTTNVWPVNFGRIPYSIPHYFKGSLDEIGIWNRVLTITEIQQLFNGNGTCSAVGINEEEINLAGLNVYPNPSNGTFNLKSIEGGNIIILDALGKIVYTSYMEGNEVQEVNNLKEGIYLIIMNDVGKQWKKKIAVVK